MWGAAPTVDEGIDAVSDITAPQAQGLSSDSDLPVTTPRERKTRWRPLLAWAGVMGWGGWALLRLTGADALPVIGPAATVLLAVTPFVAAASPVPVLVALLSRRWWAAAAAGAVALALVASVAPRAVGGGRPEARGPALRVVTLNAFFGRADTGEVLDLIRRSRADVLSIQELTPDAARRLEHAGLTRLLPHTVIDPRPGAAGSGLYSRYPLRPLRSPGGTVFAHPAAALTLPGGRTAEISAVHPVPPTTKAAYRYWRHDMALLPAAAAEGGASAAANREPVRILAGDFNATLDHATLRTLIGRGYADAADRAGAGLVPTWSAIGEVRPPLTIDHVLVDRRCAVTDVDVHTVRGTDHRAVVAGIRLP